MARMSFLETGFSYHHANQPGRFTDQEARFLSILFLRQLFLLFFSFLSKRSEEYMQTQFARVRTCS